MDLMDILGSVARTEIGLKDLEKEKQKEQTKNLIDLMVKGYQPYEPEFTRQTPESYMATGQLQMPVPGPIPKDVLTFPEGVNTGSKYWKKTETTPSSFVGELPTPPKGKAWVNQPKLDTKTNKWYMEPTLVGIGAEKGDELSTGQKITSEMNLRKEFTSHPVTKDFMEITNKYGRMVDAFNNISKTSSRNAIDQAIINNFNKINDPSSVVRESEYARSPEGLSAIERMRAVADKVAKGGAGLTDEERKLFVDLAGSFYDSTADSYKAVKQDYIDIANSYGFAPDKVVPPSYSKFALTKKGITPIGAEAVKTATNPKTGEKRYTYDGGKTWQKK